MSIIYCDIHDEHFDSDYDTDCRYCEEEAVENPVDHTSE